MENTKPFGIGRIVALISAAVIIIGALLPWGLVQEIKHITYGYDGDGVITIPLAVIAIILLIIKKVPFWISLIIGLMVSAIGFIDYAAIADATAEIGSVGIGMYLTIIGGIGLTIGALMIKLIKGPVAE
ncbi:hypothetical protein CVV38_03545 [Candidatus Peregrinibacteria bacterium HGW-Peregrinibacteria-1]|jgi:hypothetical protein|nr:MAG: hypothetical protein CVV38_03545 [Candidatus Peregrinibacteria bacterium HGW-Peregrinibacteria-1]